MWRHRRDFRPRQQLRRWHKLRDWQLPDPSVPHGRQRGEVLLNGWRLARRPSRRAEKDVIGVEGDLTFRLAGAKPGELAVIVPDGRGWLPDGPGSSRHPPRYHDDPTSVAPCARQVREA